MSRFALLPAAGYMMPDLLPLLPLFAMLRAAAMLAALLLMLPRFTCCLRDSHCFDYRRLRVFFLADIAAAAARHYLRCHAIDMLRTLCLTRCCASYRALLPRARYARAFCYVAADAAFRCC